MKNFNQSTFWTGLLAVVNLVAIAVLAALGHPVPPILEESFIGIIAGHLALSSPVPALSTTTTDTQTNASPARAAPAAAAAPPLNTPGPVSAVP